MVVGDGITLSAVVVALVIGVVSIVTIMRIQRSEQKQRQLKEIEKWAKETIRLNNEYIETGAITQMWADNKWRWWILKETKIDMKEAADRIDKCLGQKVDKAVKCFDVVDMNIGRCNKHIVHDSMSSCTDACREVLKTAAASKFR